MVLVELRKLDPVALMETDEFLRVRDDLYTAGGNHDDHTALYETVRRRVWRELNGPEKV